MKYNTGDKVVLRKDLVVGAEYGKCIWVSAINPLADKDYVTIKDVCSFDCYKPEEAVCYAISDEMIQGLYEEETKMKYQVGDKVVLREGLSGWYGGCPWSDGIGTLTATQDYVVIDDVDVDGTYNIKVGSRNYAITEGMIQGLYTVEETKMSEYKVGDKVVLRKDLEVGECYGEWAWTSGMDTLTTKEYVVIGDIDEDGDYSLKGGSYNYVITDEMIQGLYTEGEDRFLFRTEEVAGYSLFLRKGALLGELSHVGDIETLAESADYLLTVEEAKQSPLYSSLIKVPLSEAVAPKYVLNKGDLYVGRLNSAKGPIVIGSDCELEGLDIVTEFTDTEVEDIQQTVADLTVNKA